MTWNERVAVVRMYRDERKSNAYIAMCLGLEADEVKRFTSSLVRQPTPNSRASKHWRLDVRTGEEVE